MNAIQKFIEAEHKYLDLNEINYKEYEQMVEPLRDVECVVRCKDCISRSSSECQNDDLLRQIHDCGCGATFHTDDDWFCPYGKRKDGDGE